VHFTDNGGAVKKPNYSIPSFIQPIGGHDPVFIWLRLIQGPHLRTARGSHPGRRQDCGFLRGRDPVERLERSAQIPGGLRVLKHRLPQNFPNA
jgi:hypothetical protein